MLDKYRIIRLEDVKNKRVYPGARFMTVYQRAYFPAKLI